MDVIDANSLYTLKVIALIFVGCPAMARDLGGIAYL